MSRRQEVVRENERILQDWEHDTKRYNDTRTLTLKRSPEIKTVIEVWQEDTLNAAWRMAQAGARPAVLNMASDKCPGGGYLKGASAQEEELCRRTTLYASLRTQRYPWKPYTVLYTPDVLVFRDCGDTGYKKFNRSNRMLIDVVSAAAVRRPKLAGGQSDYASETSREIMRNKIRGILLVAAAHGHKEVLLSAFGCGAFRNPAPAVATLFRQVLQEVQGVFTRVVFAILDNRYTSNWQTFHNILCNE